MGLQRTGLWTACSECPAGPVGIGIQTALGLDAAAYARLTLWTGDERTTGILGQPLWSELLDTTGRAVLPACLRDSDRHRAAWAVSVMPACPVHGAILVDRRQVRARLRWGGLGAHRCGHRACRFDLREATAEPADPNCLGSIRALGERLTESRPYRKGEVEAFVSSCTGGAPAMWKGDVARRGLSDFSHPAVRRRPLPRPT